MPVLPQHLRLVGVLCAAAATLSAQDRALPAVNRAYLDTTCSPCKDFYRFANGAWLDSVTIPPDRETWGPLAELQQRNQAFVSQMLDSLGHAPQRHARTGAERKVGTFYRACMDSTAQGTVALRALEPELRRIAAIRTPADLGEAVGRLWRYQVQVVFGLGESRDPDDRIGIGLRAFWNAFSIPSLHRYLAADSGSVLVRDAFVAMLTRVFEGLGDPPDSAVVNAGRVLSFETALARSRPADSGAVWLSLAELRRVTLAFDWQAFVRELGRPDLPSIGMRPRSMVRTIDSLATSVPLEEWKAYLRWRLVFAVAPGLDHFRSATSDFMRVATGRQQAPPRAQQCGLLTTRWLGGGVARAFVARTFPPEARTAARTMVEGMREALRERIAALEWLGPASRGRALAKLDAMSLWIGYPDRLDDLAGLEVRDGAATPNQLAARRYQMDRQMALVGTQLDRERWVEANPAFAEATYYGQNALLITAAQLQPPFFDPRSEPAANYGKIGEVMGHELTHAFDSNGRLYNEFGKLAGWWTPDEVREFTRRADLIVQQYDQYVVSDSLRQNGRATLSENLADIGGITLAWLAYRRAMEGRPREIIDGFTPEQRFFIAHAQSINTEVWRPELLRTQAQIDQYSHSVPQWRINGPLAHLPAFAAAFGCKEGDSMVRPAALRWSVW